VRRRRRPSRRHRSGGRKRRIAVGAAALVVGLVVALFLSRGEDLIRSVTLPLKHEDIIRQQAADKGVPADLIAAVIYAESRFRDQTSAAGARGLMQITPQTAQIIEDKSGGSTFTLQDLSDPDVNIRYGTFYLKYLLDRFDGNEVAAIAAYNAGETNVKSWGGAGLTESDIKFPETRGYVDDVLAKRKDYRRSYRSELGL
jgi:soluble lytic murein transglycosylase